MRYRFHALGCVAISLTTAAAIAGSQVRVDVRLVNVVATVIDSRGRSIPNLKMDDFILEEDGKAQQITHFSQDQNVPVSVGILLDTSGSMDRKMRTAVEAVDRFSRRIQPNDEIFLITFSGRALLRQDFTDDREKISQALRHLNATGGTALYDALIDGLTKIQSGRHGKHGETRGCAAVDSTIGSVDLSGGHFRTHLRERLQRFRIRPIVCSFFLETGKSRAKQA